MSRRAVISLALLCLGGGTATGQVERPALVILSPTADEVLGGVVSLAADVHVSGTVRSVTFFVDGQRACAVLAVPYRCDWDSAAIRGARDVRVVAELADGTRLVQTVRTRGAGAAFRASADSVVVPVRVRDRQKRFVRGLGAESFRLFEDGVAQPIVTFSSESAGGDVVLALDGSGSMTAAVPELRAAARAFLGALPRNDMVTVTVFNTAIEVLAPRGSDPVSRVAALNQLRAAGSTALYDVMIQAVDLFPASVERRAIVMFTDGDDVSSRASIATARTALQSASVVLYVIAQGKASVDRSLRAELSALARETGGGAFFAPRMSDTRDHFAEIAEELSNQYLLGYAPARPFGDGAWRQIRVEATDTNHRYDITAREGYLAAKRAVR